MWAGCVFNGGRQSYICLSLGHAVLKGFNMYNTVAGLFLWRPVFAKLANGGSQSRNGIV